MNLEPKTVKRMTRQTASTDSIEKIESDREITTKRVTKKTTSVEKITSVDKIYEGKDSAKKNKKKGSKSKIVTVKKDVQFVEREQTTRCNSKYLYQVFYVILNFTRFPPKLT